MVNPPKNCRIDQDHFWALDVGKFRGFYTQARVAAVLVLFSRTTKPGQIVLSNSGMGEEKARVPQEHMIASVIIELS